VQHLNRRFMPHPEPGESVRVMTTVFLSAMTSNESPYLRTMSQKYSG